MPDQAKSAGTVFILGADQIYMGPTSDLGPVDPQLQLPDGSLAAAGAIIAAVEEAERRVQQVPESYPLHAYLLEPVTGLMVQQARDALERTGDLIKEALASAPTRGEDQVQALAQRLHRVLIEETKSHSTTISARDAINFGLPVEEADPASNRWQALWRLWTKYAVLNATRIYEGQTASYVTLADFALPS